MRSRPVPISYAQILTVKRISGLCRCVHVMLCDSSLNSRAGRLKKTDRFETTYKLNYKRKLKMFIMKSSGILRMVSRAILLVSLVCFYRQQKDDVLMPIALEGRRGSALNEDSTPGTVNGVGKLQRGIIGSLRGCANDDRIKAALRGIRWFDELAKSGITKCMEDRRIKAFIHVFGWLDKLMSKGMDRCTNNSGVQAVKRGIKRSLTWAVKGMAKCLESNKVQAAWHGVTRSKEWITNKTAGFVTIDVPSMVTCSFNKSRHRIVAWTTRYGNAAKMKNIVVFSLAWSKTACKNVYKWFNMGNFWNIILRIKDWQTKLTSRLIYRAKKVEMSAVQQNAKNWLANTAYVVCGYVNWGILRGPIESIRRAHVVVADKIAVGVERSGIKEIAVKIVKLGEGRACTGMVEMLRALEKRASVDWIRHRILGMRISYVKKEIKFKQTRGMRTAIDEELKQEMDGFLKGNWNASVHTDENGVAMRDGGEVLDRGINDWIKKHVHTPISIRHRVYGAFGLMGKRASIWWRWVGQRLAKNLGRIMRHARNSQKKVPQGRKTDGNGCAISKSAQNREIREELGRGTWRLLHTMASKFPVDPSEQDKKNVIQFLSLLAKLFPCEECSMHFQKLLNDHVPVVSSRKEFELWLCSAHNVVNKRLGKPIFDCEGISDVWGCGCEI
ncbi:hypothetical protein VCUG_01206 [Vavraia culicis subsp. floridensis]|uniref:Sulfhydryl oxidase n=1 Tax=Vavraia culicis (isolate floridensis) TaxID=948595 RepID=L2GVE1_VAVCU|nr:uncharacterized protein VCUG_01206 [Vavraia culicis subsp. floridensis]ELA47322.1 hypothetical protein VCUG_01206 [Vavraia culicis subsp. floridensis]